jgi:CBS domain containing-hemolysin-like protein
MTAIFQAELKRPGWQKAIVLILAFWLSASLVLDLVIMPSLYVTGMMDGAGFATAGYSIFWIFNRIELLCAGLVVTGFLVLQGTQTASNLAGKKPILLALFLLGIALIYTYIFTPGMSALGLELNLFESANVMPAGMIQMHEGYWILEVCKLILGATLLSWSYRNKAN